MNSYILPFRGWIAATAILLVIEAAIYLYAAPGPFDRTNFLQFSFAHGETPQRLFVLNKIQAFADSNPTIVQSGDSSGFYGIEPAVVAKHLPKDVSYLNMSCCANLGYRGYYNILDVMARHNTSIRYMVLHITPYTMPRPELWDEDGADLWGAPELKVFGNAVYEEFLSFWRIFHFPSLAYRPAVTDATYNLRPLVDYMNRVKGRPPESNRPVLNENYREFLNVFRQNRGFMPESDVRGGVYAAECEVPTPTFFSFRRMSKKTYLEEILEAYEALAKRHGATLVVVFQPVGCVMGTGSASAEARAVIDRFKRDHSEVEIPFPLIETWPTEMFSVPAHVRREYTDLIGDRLGKAMAEIIDRREGAPRPSPASQ
jgi:hypothetical protein